MLHITGLAEEMQAGDEKARREAGRINTAG
jgi:hypothetical protein